MEKRYLGDGAYVEFDGYALVLTTEDGIRATNRVVLEPEVWRALEAFVAELTEERKATDATEERST